MYKNWKDLIAPKALEFEREELNEKYGKFVAKPLERGYGITLGNSLRRVLLSSLQGAAITDVKIDGVLHEFTSIKGVSEDVTDIILNLKEVLLVCHSSTDEVIRIDAAGEGEVKASDIQTSDQVEILNPDQHIATLGIDGKLKMEMTVKMGRGYVPAEKNKHEDLPANAIAIDSIFTPIKKVHYTVSNARVGQRTDYDKLTMEVWTSGAVRPDDALAFSAKILKEQLQVFINFDEVVEPEEVVALEPQQVVNENLLKKVEELELSVRSANCLQHANIKYIGELVQRTEPDMLKTKNFGRKSLNEIKEMLTEMGLGLGIKLDFDLYEMIAKREAEQNKQQQS